MALAFGVKIKNKKVSVPTTAIYSLLGCSIPIYTFAVSQDPIKKDNVLVWMANKKKGTILTFSTPRQDVLNVETKNPVFRMALIITRRVKNEVLCDIPHFEIAQDYKKAGLGTIGKALATSITITDDASKGYSSKVRRIVFPKWDLKPHEEVERLCKSPPFHDSTDFSAPKKDLRKVASIADVRKDFLQKYGVEKIKTAEKLKELPKFYYFGNPHLKSRKARRR